MTIGEMERYAEGLSDEELWGELGEVYDDWLLDNLNRRWFKQPRLAVMLAREIGRREGETGMMDVARWLKDLEASLEGFEKKSPALQRQFFETCVQTATFGGWVANEPNEAISRLIESGRKEEEWPIPNQGFLMYFKVDGFFAIERVLRDGFERLAQRDLEGAQRLLVEGTLTWAFDVNETFESVFEFMTEEERVAFFDAKLSKETLAGLQALDPVFLKDEFSAESFGLLAADFVDVGFWSSNSVESSSQVDLDSTWLAERLDVLVRVRSNEATRILMDPETPSETSRKIFGFLAASDSSHYELLSFVPPASRRQAVDILMEISRKLNFGPIDGREDPWGVDYEKLKAEVGKIEMDPEQRGQLVDDILRNQESESVTLF